MGIRLYWLRYKNAFAHCCFRIQIKWDIVRLKCSISAARRMLCQTFANNFWLSLKSFILRNLPWTSDCKVICVSIHQKCAMRMFSFNFFIRSSVRLVLTITQWAKDVYINDKSTLRLVSPHCCTVQVSCSRALKQVASPFPQSGTFSIYCLSAGKFLYPSQVSGQIKSCN